MLLVLHPQIFCPQQDRDFKRVSASYVGSIGSSTAILWLCWHCWHHLGINLGHLGAHDDGMWAQFRGYNSSIAKNHPKPYLQNALPHGPRGVTEETSKTIPKKKNLLQNANPHKTQPKIRLQKAIPHGRDCKTYPNATKKKRLPSRAICLRQWA